MQDRLIPQPELNWLFVGVDIVSPTIELGEHSCKGISFFSRGGISVAGHITQLSRRGNYLSIITAEIGNLAHQMSALPKNGKG